MMSKRAATRCDNADWRAIGTEPVFSSSVTHIGERVGFSPQRTQITASLAFSVAQ